MRILVIGGDGFMGKAVRRALAEASYVEPNHHVTYRSRRNGLDLTSLSSALAVISETEPDAIINLAAHVGSVHYVCEKAADVFFDNAQMALNLYQAAARIAPDARIINPLSNCSYPGDADIHSEPDWWDGEVHDSVFSYGNAKRFIYVTAKNFATQYHTNSANLLVPNCFGPGDYTDPNKTHALNGMIIRMILAKRSGADRFEVWGTGRPIREWGYIDDVARILVMTINALGNLTYPVNIAQNKGYAIGDSARMIAEAIGFKGEIFFNTKYQDGAEKKVLDDKEFRKIFPDFRFSDHEQGIRETVKYYEETL